MLNDKGEEVGIIYGWYCTVTDKWYVGQTVNPEKRFKTHIYDAIDANDNNYFHRALRKYGLENFVYCVFEENVLRDNLNMKEQEWIEYYDSFHSGYNETAGGGQTIFSKEAKKKMSESHKGQIPWNTGQYLSDETRQKISNALKGQKNPFYGKHHSIESRKRIGQYHKGKHLCEKTRHKMSESHKGILPWNTGKPSPNRKQVLKYDLNGNYIQTYISVLEAKNQNPKCGAISAVCRGERKQAGGFIWKYA